MSSGGPKDQNYSGAFSHPRFGPDEIQIEITLHKVNKGHWKCLDQCEEISVQREGKSIVLSGSDGVTVFDGHEVVGGMLIGAVIQNGEAGGHFHLSPKSRVRTSLVRTTSIQRRVQVTQVPVVWRAVGIPTKLAVQQKVEAGWTTTYPLPCRGKA